MYIANNDVEFAKFYLLISIFFDVPVLVRDYGIALWLLSSIRFCAYFCSCAISAGTTRERGHI